MIATPGQVVLTATPGQDESQQGKAMVGMVAGILKAVQEKRPPEKDQRLEREPVSEEASRAREERYMAVQKRRHKFRTPAEELYADITAIHDMKEHLAAEDLRLQAKAYVRTNVNPHAPWKMYPKGTKV